MATAAQPPRLRSADPCRVLFDQLPAGAVERHHGRVAVSSEPERGSKFEFTLGVEAT